MITNATMTADEERWMGCQSRSVHASSREHHAMAHGYVNLNNISADPDDKMIMRFNTENNCPRGQSNRYLKYNGTYNRYLVQVQYSTYSGIH